MASVLIIDDTEDTRHLLAAMVTACGHQASTASSGTEGLQAIRSRPFDIVLLDLWMPEVNGLRVLADLSMNRPAHLPRLLMMTASADADAERQAAIQLGAEGFLSKTDIDFDWLTMLLSGLMVAVDEIEAMSNVVSAP